MLVKRFCRKHLTIDTQYHLWYLFLLMLCLPFIPYRFFSPDRLLLRINQILFTDTSRTISGFAKMTSRMAGVSDFGLRDFSMATASSSPILPGLLWVIWIAGMLPKAILFMRTVKRIHCLRKQAYHVTPENEPELYRQYRACCRELRIRRTVRLYASCSLSGPVSYGWIHPTVMIPQDLDIVLSEEELRFVFLHELQHYKHMDALVNELVCLFQVLYWFNPLIRYGLRRLQLDREIACDHSVLHVVGKTQAVHYGYTLLNCAERMKNGSFFSPLSGLGGSKDTIRQRIAEIAAYQKDSAFRKLKSICILLPVLLLTVCASPLLCISASQNDIFSFTDEHWVPAELSSCFDGAEGSFVLYDMKEKQYQIYNRELSVRRVSPDSTFKIYSGLFALEEGLISPDSTLQKWDGTPQMFEAWNHDQTLSSAMKNSVNWYFQNLDKQLGMTALSSFYHRISYGNCDLSGGLESYWAESCLKISPVEQVILLTGLLENKWGFQEENIQAVKDAMLLTETSFGRLYGKTGTGAVHGQNTNGWFVGFLEKQGNTYCFAANIHGTDASGGKAAEITMEILNMLLG